MDEIVMRRALGAWGVRCETVRKDLQLAGSPERCLGRAVVEGVDGALFFIEQIDPETAPRKREMARLMRRLEKGGIAVAAPLVDHAGESLVAEGERLWQLTPFVEGVPLERPLYTQEVWRGEALANFLLDMRRLSGGFPCSLLGNTFDLPAYIDALTQTLETHEPKAAVALVEVTSFLKDRLYPHWASLPLALAHGDVHGINILWKEKGIASVIDWEFFGRRPLLYDVANMVGCCGIETPDALLKGLGPTLIRFLKQSGFADATSWHLLPECIIALRYAWLSEWLRKEDTEMINLELSYIYLLMDNREKLVKAWAL